MAGWVIQVEIDDASGEHVSNWIVASPDWMAATRVAKMAQEIDSAGRQPDARILNTRAIRAATNGEIAGLSHGEAKRV